VVVLTNGSFLGYCQYGSITAEPRCRLCIHIPHYPHGNPDPNSNPNPISNPKPNPNPKSYPNLKLFNE